MTTALDLIHTTRNQYLMSGQSDRLNVLNTTVDDTTQTIGIRHELKGIATGTTLCIGLEEMHVLQTGGSVAGSTITVIRGMNGSTAAAHTAGDLIRVNPQFSDHDIFNALNDALDQLSADGLFQVKSTDLTFNPAIAGYVINVPDMISIWKVSFDHPGPSNDWPTLFADMYAVDHAPDSTDFPGGGSALLLKAGGSAGHKVRVSYFAGFSPLTDLADDVEGVAGLHAEAHRLLPVSAAIQLMGGREVRRSFTNRQTDRRLVEEVPPGAARQALEPLMDLYQMWVRQEARRLKKKFPRQV